MKSTSTLFISLAGALLLGSGIISSAQTREQRLQDHVYYFASDSLQGREAGTIYSAKAAEYIIGEYEKIGLVPMFSNEWKLSFERPHYSDRNFFDVVGVIPGSDPVLSKEYIVLGAHFDHLGTKADGTVYNGADDNASGSAALIEIARELMKNRSSLKRSVVIAAFDGEELGLYGSYALAAKMKEEGILNRVKLMVSIDMVGWLRATDELTIEGVGTVKNGRMLINSSAEKNSLKVNLKKFETSILTATDTQGFAEKGIATLDMTTGTKSPYHKPEDDAELIDYKGMDKIVAFASDFTQQVSSDTGFAPSGKVAPKHRSRMSFIELGPKVGIGSSRFVFPQSSVYTRGGFSYNAGASLKLNISRPFGIEVDALYENSRAGFPVEGNLFGAKGKYAQEAVTVPAYLIFHDQDRITRYYIGIGCYFTHVLNSRMSSAITESYAIKSQQEGLAMTFGFGVGPYIFSVDVRESLANRSVFENIGGKARFTTSTFNITYLF